MKEIYLEYLENLEGLVGSDKIVPLQEQIKTQELLVPIVGAFSSGKSSMLNNYLKEDILLTNIAPETALATELRYSDSEHIEAVREDGSVENFEIGNMEGIKQRADEFSYIKLYLNNEELKKTPFIFVDMPGFNSPYEIHNKAIVDYLYRGVYFTVLFSIENGLSKKILREIANINLFKKDMLFILNKVDLRAKKDIDELVEYMSEEIEDVLEKKVTLHKAGLESKNVFKELIDGIDVATIHKNLFSPPLKNLTKDIETSLVTKIKSLSKNKESIDEDIEKLQDSIVSIQKEKEKILENIDKNFTKKSVDKIVSSLRNDLLNNTDYLSSVMINSKDSFELELNEIIKSSIINSLEKEYKMITDKVVDDLSATLKTIKLNEIGINLDEITSGIKERLSSATSVLERVSKIVSKGSKTYKYITTLLAVLTKTLNPIIEAILIFLPEILSIFIDKKESAKKEFVSNIVPSITNTLRGKIPAIVSENLTALIQSISQEFEQKLSIAKEQYENTKQEMLNKQRDIQEEIKELEEKLQKLNESSKFLYGEEHAKSIR